MSKKEFEDCPHCKAKEGTWFDRTIDNVCNMMLDRCNDCGKGVDCKYVGDNLDCDNCEWRKQ